MVSCWEPSSLKLLSELLNDLTQNLLQDLCSPPLYSPLLRLGILNLCWGSLEILFSQSSPTRHISLATCTNSLSFLMCIPHPNPAYFICLFSPLDSLPYCLSASTLDQREWNKSLFYLHLFFLINQSAMLPALQHIASTSVQLSQKIRELDYKLHLNLEYMYLVCFTCDILLHWNNFIYSSTYIIHVYHGKDSDFSS